MAKKRKAPKAEDFDAQGHNVSSLSLHPYTLEEALRKAFTPPCAGQESCEG